jgi:hypothetical protein
MIVAATIAGCGDSTGPGGETNITGTYSLRTINGQTLPFPLVVVGTTYRLEVTAGSVTINANGTYTGSSTLREIQGTSTITQTESSSGTWTRIKGIPWNLWVLGRLIVGPDAPVANHSSERRFQGGVRLSLH